MSWSVRALHGFRDPRIAVGPEGVLYVLKNRHVTPIDMSDPGRPRRHPPLRLAAEGRELLVLRWTLFVATASGLEAYSLLDPLAPARIWSWPLAGGVDDLALADDVLAVIRPDGFLFLDVTRPSAPEEYGSHRLIRGLPGCWEVDPVGPYADLVRWAFPDGRRVGQFDGRTLIVGDLFDMIALDVARDGIVERVYSPTVVPGRVREMRLHRGYVYTDTLGDFGFVVRVGDGELPLEGLHGLDGWADNAVLTSTVGYRSTCRGVEVAYVP